MSGKNKRQRRKSPQIGVPTHSISKYHRISPNAKSCKNCTEYFRRECKILSKIFGRRHYLASIENAEYCKYFNNRHKRGK